MTFSNLLFLFLFLPICLAAFHLSGKAIREGILLFFSLLFYACGSPDFFLILLFLSMINLLCGRLLKKSGQYRKAVFFSGIVLNLLFLIYYKYSFFFLSEIIGRLFAVPADILLKLPDLLPLGISFFCFRAVSYLADIYRGNAEPGPFYHDALYLCIFTQISSGPLARYKDMTAEPGSSLFTDGLIRFVTGFSKKIMLADVLSSISAEVFSSDPQNLTTGYAWLGSICFSLQLYYDFSGYSDMAVGLTEMFGFHCPENFNYPYLTDSVSQFWKRWHITLGAWFRDYVYIPLGGSRNKQNWKLYRNLFVVWILTGLWHGANWTFIFWGMGYFILISLEKMLCIPGRFRSGLSKLLYRFFSLLFINCQWVLFRSENLKQGAAFLRNMFVYRSDPLLAVRTRFLISDYKFYLAAALLFCFPVVPFLRKKLQKKPLLNRIFELAVLGIIGILFVFSLTFIVSDRNNPFLYTNF